ncbi:capsule assembly Wzi family protein [Melioribacteraceae bacterium 4301-Me]|uniref:capsule assembly Wzi family protein n=1 Tax=Pyranulibacter aquaticus TaxID=3163344 RepID=UPI00359753CF
MPKNKTILFSKKLLSLRFTFIIFFCPLIIYSQIENVPLDNEVYSFLKEMKVKGLISSIHEDDPIMTRLEVANLLKKIDDVLHDSIKVGQTNLLSHTEIERLKKFQNEFYDDKKDINNTAQLIGSSEEFSYGLSEFFSNKIKHLYAYRDSSVSFYIEGLGRFIHGQKFNDIKNNSELFDIGFELRGTILNHLGYMMMVDKGGISGSSSFAKILDPRLNYNFKYIENIEKISNYDFTQGYLKYFSQPSEKMNYSVQIGREKIKMGYGYSSSLFLSGEHPDLDFVKFNFNYGVLNFTSLTASTVGYFNIDRSLDYTKYIAANRLQIIFPDLFEIGMGESIVYSGRGIELAYLNPFIFYKFVEMSLQDRDNGTFYLNFQTNFIRNFELQATYFLDENPITRLSDLSRYINKTAYKIGAFWYNPFSIPDFQIILEYTRIRPYVYTHTNIENNYTAFGALLGDKIGPNSDEIYSKIAYYLNAWAKLTVEYSHVRSGKNVVDSQGNLIRNVGGDPAAAFRYGIDNEEAEFLDGIRINTDQLIFTFRLEPIRKIYFDLIYNYTAAHNITDNTKTNLSYGMIKMSIEY